MNSLRQHSNANPAIPGKPPGRVSIFDFAESKYLHEFKVFVEHWEEDASEEQSRSEMGHLLIKVSIA